MNYINEGWEERFEVLGSVDYFGADVYCHSHELKMLGLTGSELARLQYKLSLVESLAVRLATGMLKGVLKYNTDDLTPEEWTEHIFSESADLLNYLALFEASKLGCPECGGHPDDRTRAGMKCGRCAYTRVD